MGWEFEGEEGEGWVAANSLTGLKVTGGVVRTRVTGDDAHMCVTVRKVRAEEVTHVVVRMRSTKGGPCQVYFGTEARPLHALKEVPEFTCPGGEEFREFGVEVSGLAAWRGRVEMLRLDPVNGAGGVDAEVEIDWIRLIRRAVRPVVVSFGGSEAWVRRGEDVRLRLEVVNMGGGRLTALSAVVLERGERKRGVLTVREGKRCVFEWRVRPQARIAERYRAEVWDAEKKVCEAETVALTVAGEELPAAGGRRGIRKAGGTIVVETRDVMAVLVGTGGGIEAAVVRMRVGDSAQWKVAGVCMPLAAVNVWEGGVNRVVVPRMMVEQIEGRGRVVMRGAVEGIGWLRTEISVGERDEVMSVGTEFSAVREVDVMRMSGPALLAGEGSFAEKKNGGLFAGLEYLEGEERSSNSEGLGEKHGLRVAPWPCEVSVPVMAIGTPEGGVIGMMWDATQAWDGVEQMVMAEYATPNFADGQKNHLMACFVPAWPAWTERNERIAKQPYRMRPGQRLRIACDIFGLRAAGMEDVVPLVYAVQGLPKLLTPARTLESTLEVCMRGWAETCYDKERDGFLNHWRCGEQPVAMPHIKAGLLAYARQTGNARWITAVNMVTNARIVDIVGPLWRGFGARPAHVEAALASQKADGRWVYDCTPEVAKKTRELTGGTHDTLGREGESTVGLCAMPAWHILQHARLTGDAGAVAAGTNALEAMGAFRKPAGAQTWEVHMDAPDIFAAALAADCYRIGYELTGERRYLNAAVRWARTGLPFLYSYAVPHTGPGAKVMIPDDELTEGREADAGFYGSDYVFGNAARQITPCASLAVFGTSFYVVSWFAHVVQWCGMRWAGAVYDLLPYTNDVVLAHAADGVLLSGCQQTLDKGPVVGLLPDSWHLESNTIYPAYIAPMRVEEALRQKLDMPQYGMTRTAIVGGRGGARRHISTHGGVYAAREEGGRLRWRQRFLAGEPCDTVVCGGGEPRGVNAGGTHVPRVADAGIVAHGWHYDAGRGLVCQRVQHEHENEQIEVQFGATLKRGQ